MSHVTKEVYGNKVCTGCGLVEPADRCAYCGDERNGHDGSSGIFVTEHEFMECPPPRRKKKVTV